MARLLIIVCFALAALALPITATADMEIFFPSNVAVGQTGVPASIELENGNNAPNEGATNVVCNPGDPLPCQGIGIFVTPSCGAADFFNSCTAPDPGVFQLSPTGTGRAGSVCAGTTFTITLLDAMQGRFRFTPQPAGTHITLPGAGSACIVDFTVDVLKLPTLDSDAVTPGIQTIQTGAHAQEIGDTGTIIINIGGDITTVANVATPTLTGTTSAMVPVGANLTNTATLSGGNNPAGSITFQLFGPDNADCSGVPIFTTSENVAGNGQYVSDPFIPQVPGVYRWVLRYNGDGLNNPVSTACNAPNSVVTVAAIEAIPALDARGLALLALALAAASLFVMKRVA
ncbi:MAG TPA: hypothetical protein VF618_24275 [Thermoanaerobaculia bacterium]